ncbi:MAG: serine/threonine protein kinase [Actinobacteria bacterium]|nr:serine/threonine protein kinase [Actinomycetota bacterium]
MPRGSGLCGRHAEPPGRGSGGFADVFRYQQAYPRREVAVKVLVKEHLAAASIEAFAAEANIMARLATHPAIVAIHQAGVSRDGRPYLVMEYCPRPNLQRRHRQAPLSEAETLRIGVQIAGAIETAHRAGVLHRDIKPANILVTAYGTPKLTDLGIAAVVGGVGASQGLSILWSAPETVTAPGRASAASDVYALAATLHTLLANRSPFEIPGAPNAAQDLITQILTDPVPPLGRGDVSAACDDALRRALSRIPPSALLRPLDADQSQRRYRDGERDHPR